MRSAFRTASARPQPRQPRSIPSLPLADGRGDGWGRLTGTGTSRLLGEDNGSAPGPVLIRQGLQFPKYTNAAHSV